MIQFIVASFFLCQSLGDATPIIGGHFSSIGSQPWLASVQVNKNHVCGGSILSDSVILTAAHCTNKPMDKMNVRVGSSVIDEGGSVHKVVEIIKHAEKKFLIEVSSDLALLKVSPPMEFGRSVSNVTLAEKNSVLRSNADAVVSGWGVTSESDELSWSLQSANVRIIDNDKCAEGYNQDYAFWFRGLFKDSFGVGAMCASAPETGACDGDSGGPLMVDGAQVGIVSWGRNCANPNYPGVYVRVATFRDWIDENLKNLQSSKPDEHRRPPGNFLDAMMKGEINT